MIATVSAQHRFASAATKGRQLDTRNDPIRTIPRARADERRICASDSFEQGFTLSAAAENTQLTRRTDPCGPGSIHRLSVFKNRLTTCIEAFAGFFESHGRRPLSGSMQASFSDLK